MAEGAGEVPAPEVGFPGGCVGAYWRGGFVRARFRSDGALQERAYPAEHSFFLRAENLRRELSGAGSVEAALRRSRAVSSVRVEGEWARVLVRDRDALDGVCGPGGWAQRAGVETFEGDLHPVKRWLLAGPVPIGRPVRAYLDVEAHLPRGISPEGFRSGRLLCVSACDELDRDAFTHVLAEDSDDAERELIARVLLALEPYDQVLAWNGDRFDFEFLAARAQELGGTVEWRRWLRLDHMELCRRMNVSASKSGAEKQSMALAAWKAHFLGEKKKVDLAEGRHVAWEMWRGGGRSREELAAYCRDDAGSMARIERRTGFVELHQTICEVAGVLPDSRAIGPKQSVESFLMRLGHARGMRFPSFFGYEGAGEEATEDRSSVEVDLAEVRGDKLFKGAFVLKPTRLGLVENVHVCDFSRLYPSIAQTFNLSPETLYRRADEVKAGEPRPEGVCEAIGSGHWFRTEPRGLLPYLFDEMLRLRAVWDDRKKAAAPGTNEWNEADKRSTAYKNMTNAAFGVTGSRWSRFFVVECAESMTLGGAALLRVVIEEGERQGIETIAGDTDSSFAAGVLRAEYEAFVARLNREVFPRLAADRGARDCRIKLAYEKAFELVAFMAGKRYAGRYAHYKGAPPTEDSEPEIKGLEYKRGDSSRLARAMQAAVLDLLLGGGVLEDPERGLDEYGRPRKTLRRARCERDPEVFRKLVVEWRARIVNEALPLSEIVVSKRLSREPEHYKRPKRKDGSLGLPPQQARAGLMARERGRDVGAGVRVEYLVSDAREKSLILAEDYDGTNVDRAHLWENLVYPPTQRVLEVCFPAVRWADYRPVRKHLGSPGQRRLFEY